jgi:hypothetical protein
MTKKKQLLLAVFCYVFLTTINYFIFSIGNKSFDFHDWSSDGGVGFGCFQILFSVVGVVVTVAILVPEKFK